MSQSTREYIFDTWAPRDSRWSRWVKPVLFAHLHEVSAELSGIPAIKPRWCPLAERSIALVLDLPGDAGVVASMHAAEQGFRPVPLYNALPPPPRPREPEPFSTVDVGSVMRALVSETPRLAAASLPPDAPPAFLLDASRRGEKGARLSPGDFDNRSVAFETDFPSSDFLRQSGIERVVLVQAAQLHPADDLIDILLHWKRSEMTIEALCLDAHGLGIQPCPIEPTSVWGRLWRRFRVESGMRRNAAREFGGFVPHAHGG